ncbi:MAG: hypothetical protein Q9180_001366 [Flavoplaca navasiana]
MLLSSIPGCIHAPATGSISTVKANKADTARISFMAKNRPGQVLTPPPKARKEALGGLNFMNRRASNASTVGPHTDASKCLIHDRTKEWYIPDPTKVKLIYYYPVLFFERHKRFYVSAKFLQEGRIAKDVVHRPEGRGKRIGKYRMGIGDIEAGFVLVRDLIAVGDFGDSGKWKGQKSSSVLLENPRPNHSILSPQMFDFGILTKRTESLPGRDKDSGARKHYLLQMS